MTTNVPSSAPALPLLNSTGLTRFLVKLDQLKLEYASRKDLKSLQTCHFKCRLNWAHEYRIFETPSISPTDGKPFAANNVSVGFGDMSLSIHPLLEWAWKDSEFEFEYRTQYAPLMHLKLLEFTVFRRTWKWWSIAFYTARIDLQTLATGSQRVRLHLYPHAKTVPTDSSNGSSQVASNSQVPGFILSFTCSMTQYFAELHLHLNRWTGTLHSDMARQMLTHADTKWLLRLCMFNTTQQQYSTHDTALAKPFIKLHHRHKTQLIVVDWQHTRWTITRATVDDLQRSGVLLFVYNPTVHILYSAIIPFKEHFSGHEKIQSDSGVSCPLQQVKADSVHELKMPAHIQGHFMELRLEPLALYQQTALPHLTTDARHLLQHELNKLITEKIRSIPALVRGMSKRGAMNSMPSSQSSEKITPFAQLQAYSHAWSEYFNRLASTHGSSERVPTSSHSSPCFKLLLSDPVHT